jgi:hypothetical protein
MPRNSWSFQKQVVMPPAVRERSPLPLPRAVRSQAWRQKGLRHRRAQPLAALRGPGSSPDHEPACAYGVKR